jgi:hypothetical protein
MPGVARADKPCDRCTPLVLGFNLDLLPTVLSAADGEL